MQKTSQYLLEKKDMTNPSLVPEWLIEEYKTFHNLVTDRTFPCYFGMGAENKGELRYAYLPHNDWSHFPEVVESFLGLFEEPPFIRHGLFVFVEPEKEEKSLDYYRQYFWRILQYLHDHDPHPWPEDIPKDPDHFLWDFCFAGKPFFAFGNCPAYKQRKTRNLGNSLILGIQPRMIFEGLEGTQKGGIMSRERVRERVQKWDKLPKHPDISHYGDPSHNEWKQFFIGDDIEPIKGKCPLHL
ncbi:YqcI/YcgG family protein [Pueribacillus theae]|uniref:YqcI/YcgG family protein n=1 Tax=Pueribacillus theae TaxID=2171751 RepID=A0A2U1JSR4_9BACI|nr:YqcI/YcgG family protein [Pueribacillus theae]PWA08009.1 YqcI/YcgG family protein [Pueribacillus theae]